MDNSLIKRQDAIDATWFEPSYTDPLNVLTEVRDRLKVLPSAQPERKKGKWIYTWYGKEYRCSICGGIMIGTPKYCSDCGAEMEV